MKCGRFLISFSAILLLLLCMAVCACAADIRPTGTDHFTVDPENGAFCLAVKDMDRISHGGYFTASLYLEDHYDAGQIESMIPGDTVLVNGVSWTIREVIIHSENPVASSESYEICTEEENDGYIVFIRAEDGCFFCRINDWVPVFPVGEIKVMLPLPDSFVYYSSESEEPLLMDAFLNDLVRFGNTFSAYNTSCIMKDGILVSVTHSSYPEGPAAGGE